MVIWSGKGFLILVFLVIGATLGTALGKFINNDAIGIGLTFIIAGLINILLVRFVSLKSGKVYIDTETGDEVIIDDGSALFFIPVKYWTYILIIGGILYAIAFGLFNI